MKSLLLLAAASLSLCLGACRSGDSTPKPGAVPPGSGGRGETPGQHAQQQRPS